MSLEWWNFDDSIKLAPGGPGFSFDAIGGTPTAIQEFHLWNNKGGVGAADEEGVDLEFLARLVPTNPFVSYDIEVLENAFLEVRLKGNNAWEKVIPGKLITVPTIENDSYEAIEVRANVIGDVEDGTWEILIRVHRRGYKALGSGFFESVGNGVISGLGNRSKLSLLEFSGITQDSGGPSADVDFSDLLGNLFGELDFIPGGTVTVGTTDLSAATPVAGEAFYSAAVYGSNGIEIVKANKAATPLTDANKPVIDTFLYTILAWIIQDDTGTIENDKISNTWSLDRFAETHAGSTITIHHGDAIINNNIAFHHKSSLFNLTDNNTNYIYFNSDGSFEINVTGVPEQESALLIWEFDIVGGVITEPPRDRRKIIGVQHEKLSFISKITPLAVNNKVYNSYNYNRDAFISKVVAHVIGGVAANSTVFDIEDSQDGSTFVTLFTDQTKRPSILGGEFIDTDAKPQRRKIVPDSILRLNVDAISDTPPDEFVVTVLLEIP